MLTANSYSPPKLRGSSLKWLEHFAKAKRSWFESNLYKGHLVFHGAVAQLVEHLICIQDVTDSSSVSLHHFSAGISTGQIVSLIRRRLVVQVHPGRPFYILSNAPIS